MKVWRGQWRNSGDDHEDLFTHRWLPQAGRGSHAYTQDTRMTTPEREEHLKVLGWMLKNEESRLDYSQEYREPCDSELFLREATKKRIATLKLAIELMEKQK